MEQSEKIPIQFLARPRDLGLEDPDVLAAERGFLRGLELPSSFRSQACYKVFILFEHGINTEDIYLIDECIPSPECGVRYEYDDDLAFRILTQGISGWKPEDVVRIKSVASS